MKHLDKVNLAEKFALFDGYWEPKIAGEEVHVMMFEPQSTVNTGSVDSDKTIGDLERI